MRTPTLRSLDAVLAAQDGVVSRDQLRALGVDRWQIRNAVAARRWTMCGPRVVVTVTGALTRRQRAWVALLHVGHSAVLASRTAAEFAGLRGWADEAIHVVVAKGVPAVPSLDGVVIHESRRFVPADMAPAASPPRVRTPRAVIDAATWNTSARAAVGLLASAVQQRLVTPEQVRAELASAGRIRHRRVMRATLDDIAGGAEALSEIDLVQGCRQRGIPEPQRQVVRLHNGRRRYLDALFTRFDGGHLAVEVDGAAHLILGTWWDDLDRQNEVVIGGEPMLRFPAARLRVDPEPCYDQIRRGLLWRRAG